jgi:antitoxin ParD1/3/4
VYNFQFTYTSSIMRTNIIIDDALMSAAMAAGAFTTKKEAVEEGLKLLARQVAYQRIRAMRGKLHWNLDGDWTKPDAATAIATVATKSKAAIAPKRKVHPRTAA